jgi:hypothetical protein
VGARGTIIGAALFAALAVIGGASSLACSYPGLDDLEGPSVKAPSRDEMPATDERETKSGTLPDTTGGGGDSSGADAGSPSAPSRPDDAGAPPPDASPPPPPPKTGAWVAVDGQDCAAVCENRGETNVPSPEGAACTSGENIPQSALAAGITYNKCYPSCNAHLAGPSPKSVGGRCYADGQKRDNDASDTTRGCFCL